MSTSRSRSPSPSSALRGPHFTSALLALAHAASTAGYSLNTIHLHPQHPVPPRSPRASPSAMPPHMPAIRIAPQPGVPSPPRRRSKRASYSTPTQSPKRSRLSQPTRRSDPVPPHAVAAVAAAAATATATSSAFWGTVMDDSTAHRTTTMPIFPPAAPVAPARPLHPITPSQPSFALPTHQQQPSQLPTQPPTLRERTGALLARISPFRSTTSSPRLTRVDQRPARASGMAVEHGGAVSSHSRSPSLSGVSHLVSSKRPRARHVSDLAATTLHRAPSAPTVHIPGGAAATAAAASSAGAFGVSASSGGVGEAKFSCELCSSKFRRKSDKNRHVRVVHEKSRPFQCPVCGKTFGEKSNMLKHRTSVHDDVRTFRCPYCDESFAQRGLCDTHVRTVHGKKQAKYFCEHCGLPFSKKQQLTEHYEQQHPQWLASYAPGYQPAMVEHARGQAGPSSMAVAAAAAAQAQTSASTHGGAYERTAALGGMMAYERYGTEALGASQRTGRDDEGAWMRSDNATAWTRARRDVASERLAEEDATSAARGARSRDGEEARRGGVTRHVDGS